MLNQMERDLESEGLLPVVIDRLNRLLSDMDTKMFSTPERVADWLQGKHIKEAPDGN